MTLDELLERLDSTELAVATTMISGAYYLASRDIVDELAAWGSDVVPVVAQRLANPIMIELPDAMADGAVWPGGNASIAETAASVLAKIGAPAADTLPAMLDAWFASTANVRYSIGRSVLDLCRHATPAHAATALIALAGDSDRYLRHAVAAELRKLGAPAYEAACMLTGDPDESVRKIAVAFRDEMSR